MFLKYNLFLVGQEKKIFFFLFIATKICITSCGCGELYSAETDEVCAMLYLMELMFIRDENKWMWTCSALERLCFLL